ncbi:DNA circularization protein [Variovorax sp. VNK109]|uniref:DNA circularization protein n=1 Tax=Variovorax sp. VNK109 TaxID=3400919 RepID=UPI003C083390
MAWRDELHQTSFTRNGQSVQAPGASFRGVPFHTVDAELGVGRRTVAHEYPQRDDPFPEDLGRRARTWNVEGYVIGDNFLAERNALWEALETAGPGELIHPLYGVLWVSVQDVARIRTTAREGGIARFTITFIEAGGNELPNALPDTTQQVDTASQAVDDAAGEAYCSAADVSGPQVLADTQASSFGQDLQGLLKTVRQVTSTEGLANLVRNVSLVSGDLTALIRTPVNLVQNLQSLQQQLVAAVSRPLSAFAEFRAVFGGNSRSSSSAYAGGTRSRLSMNENARADLQRRTAISQQARMLTIAISDGAVETADQALALRDALLAQIDSELETTDPDVATAQALSALRTAVTRDVSVRAELLQQRSTFTSHAVLPALVLAHRVYQDATRADELVTRNAVANPAFVPAGEVEILL